jgi:hypothetical protein
MSVVRTRRTCQNHYSQNSVRTPPDRSNHRPEWSEETTVTTNYKANRFVLDPNEGFGRNLKPLPLKSREEREAEDGGTYSDDDGAKRGAG